MTISGYEIIEEFSGNGWYRLHRARRTKDQAAVFIKTSRRTPPSSLDIELIRREFDILEKLSIHNTTRALELIRSDNLCCLVLEDRGALPLQSFIANGRAGLGFFLNLAIQLSAVMAELHRQQIIHRNINPRSIFIGPVTGEVELGDFTLAARTAGESQWPLPNHLPGSALCYISPEQTGRMNRATDYRTDFYSLGVTFYELLTGVCPFHSDDPLEIIHGHIAKTPPRPSSIDPQIPEPVSEIVMKLMAKTAEQRYQSASGLKEDLERCAKEWAARGEIAGFDLAERDVPDQFVVSQKLYGRDKEVNHLLDAFDQTCNGQAAMMLVAGYSGIGKTALIHELYKPIVRQRGYFIAGKFEQIAPRNPFGALIQAFRGLIQQLLTESEDRLAVWRSRLTAALGVNASVVAEVIPEIELILGKQPAPATLGPTEAHNRFQLVFQNFVGAIADKQHPLVIFLDDLQWVDSATLNLLEPLLTSPDIKYLFLIGAYRDNEVDSAHPLARTVASLEAGKINIRSVALDPLTLQDLIGLTSDTLHSEISEVEPLAQLVARKTGGNPFFVIQFLKALRQEKLIEFDYEKGHWTFRLDQIAQAEMTDNVIDLMTRKIQRLSEKAQRAITLASSIGNRFDLATLAIVNQQSREEAAEDLSEALEQGLILPGARAYDASVIDGLSNAVEPAYSFLHDRVQQAAYALIPAGWKQIVHLTVGRLLLDRLASAAVEERVFDIVNHLNIGSALIIAEAERLTLARLNLSAGERAKSSTAYEAALSYFKAGAGVLSDLHWRSEYDLVFALHLEAAECFYLCGNFEEAEREFELLLVRAKTSLDKARVYSLRIVQYESRSRYRDALRIAGEILSQLGVRFPDSDEEKQSALESEIAAIELLVGDRNISSLIDLPVMTDDEKRQVMNILTAIWPSAYISGDQVLTRLISATMVRLSLIYGNTEESAYGYVTHAITVGPVREDYESAYEFGRLALEVNERFNDFKRRAKIHQQFQAHVNLWRRPLETSIEHAREARRSGLETGDFTYAVYGAVTEGWAGIVTTKNLAEFVSDASANLTLIKKLRSANFADAERLLLNWARALMGETRNPLSVSSDEFDEGEYLQTYRDNPFFKMFYYVARLNLSYLFGQYKDALEAARSARLIAHHLSGTIWPVMLDFWSALTLAALYSDAEEGEQKLYLKEMEIVRASLAVLAENCPENFLCWSLVVEAEIERVAGRDLPALSFYERAIDYADKIGSLQQQALANEMRGRFLTGRGKRDEAAQFINEARACFSRLGARAKVEQLDRIYSQVFSRQTAVSFEAAQEGAASAERLDVVTAMKAAQAIASEIDLERLLETLMRIAIENAGAERGSLILERDGEALVQAEGTISSISVKVSEALALDKAANLSTGIVNYVRRTLESVVLADAKNDDRYASDSYIVRNQPRSILCAPVLKQGRLRAVLYLENNLATGAFTEDRIKLLQLISSEAAVSLENAQLYADMKQEVLRRRKAEEDLRAALAEVEKLKNRLQAENVYLQEEISREHNFEEIVGNSPQLLGVLANVERVAPTDSTVLIHGETGTGKELIARAIHNRSARASRPLVKVNCGAISAGLVESELFGHIKGAFTGAIDRRTGRFELADGGTLFLDEIGELPLETQVKLLRALQEGEFEPVGSSRTVRVDVRIIAATNRNLEEMVQAGRFRSDLYYRLNVFPIRVPALAERRSDVAQLVIFFLSRFAKKFGKKMDGVSQETMKLLVNYAWPGNIRELQNIIERGVILSQSPVLVLGHDLLPMAANADRLILSAGAGGAAQVFGGEQATSAADSSQKQFQTLEDVERRHILDVLDQTDWVIEGAKGAARILNLHPNTLRSRMKKLGIGRTTHEMS